MSLNEETSRITSVTLNGMLKLDNSNPNRVEGLSVRGTITQENGAGLSFLVAAGSTATVSTFGDENSDKNLAAARRLFSAVEAVYRKQVSNGHVGDTYTNEATSVHRFEVESSGAVKTDWHRSGSSLAYRLTGEYGVVVAQHRINNPSAF